MAINSDSSGFLIGERRLKEMAQGITKTEDNTKQILSVLTESFQDMQKELAQSNTHTKNAIERQNRGGKAQDASGSPQTARTVRKAVDAAEQAVDVTEQALQAAKRIRKKAIDAEVGVDSPIRSGSGVSSTSERAAQARERGANGRFIGAGGSEDNKGVLKRIKSFFGMGDVSMGNADVGGVDPTVDALRELNDAVTPVKTVFKGMSSKAVGIFKGRIKKKRNDEVLPEDQVKANKETAKSDKKQNKLLQSILSAIRGQSDGGLMGGMSNLLGKGGGLLGKLFKGGGKGLLKKIPFLGALIGGGFLAKDWNKLSSGGKGKGIGEIVGTAVGGLLGSFFGPVGTIAGGGLGHYLGSIFGEKVGTWTDSLEKIDFGALFKELLKDALNIGSKAFIPFAAGSAGFNALKGAKDWAVSKFSSGTTERVVDNTDYSGVQGNVNSAGNVAKDRKARQLGMYNALKKAGFTTEQALAHVGQIGRENDYGDKMFSTHIDPATRNGKAIRNGGAVSWNGGRYEKFAAYMREKGLMDANGNMPKTQATLDAQAAYIKKESSDPYYKNKMKTFYSDPSADPKKMAADMQSYYGWARGQSTIQSGSGRTNFDWQGAENRGNGYIDSTIPMINSQSSTSKKSMPVAKGKPNTAVLFPQGATKPAPIKVPPVSPALIKIGSKNNTQAVSVAPSDSGISQTVSDRGLAHVISGGIGYNQNNA